MSKMNIFLNFLSKIFKQWVIYLGIIPTLYDLLSAYLDYEFKFSNSVLIGFPIVIFLYAMYKVYRDEHLERIALEKKLQGPTNYQITATLYPVDFKKNELIERLEIIKSDVEKKLAFMPPFIEIYETDKNAPLSQVISFSFVQPDKKIVTTYNNKLTLYKYELEEILKNFSTYKENITTRIDELSDKFYFIEFSIKNIGITSDSEIQIDINCLNENIVFCESEITYHGMDIYKLLPKIPEKPEVKDLSNEISINKRPFSLDKPLLDIYYPNAFRKDIKITDNNCSVTIRDLHVGDDVSLFKKKLIIKKNNHDIQFDATIKSKESTRVLKPKVIIEISNTSKTLFNFEEEQ